MCLVDDEEVVAAREGRLALGWEGFSVEAHHPLALYEVHGGYEAGEVGPGIDVQAPAAP